MVFLLTCPQLESSISLKTQWQMVAFGSSFRKQPNLDPSQPWTQLTISFAFMLAFEIIALQLDTAVEEGVYYCTMNYF